MLEIKNLTKSYQKKVVLNNITISLETGVVYALVGPNGSGKTTLLNCITNLIPIDAGKITVENIDHRNINIFHYLGYCSDDKILYPYLTGYDHLAYAARNYRLDSQAILEIVESFDMANYYRKRVSSYSLGMKQKLLIALAVISNPKYIILDEPLNGLDPTVILFMREKIIEWKQQGKMILMSSHLLNEIELVTSDILFLKEGTLVYEKIPSQERGYLEKRYKELFL